MSELKPFFPPELLDELPPGNPTLKLLATMKASGHKDEEISKVTGLDLRTIRGVCAQPSVQVFIDKYSAYMLNNSPMQRFNSLVGKAIDVLTEIMESGVKDSDRVKAAGMVLDRALGTAIQRVEVKEESTIRTLLEKLSSPVITIDGEQLVKAIEYTAENAPLTFEDVDPEPATNPVDYGNSPDRLEPTGDAPNDSKHEI